MERDGTAQAAPSFSLSRKAADAFISGFCYNLTAAIKKILETFSDKAKFHSGLKPRRSAYSIPNETQMFGGQDAGRRFRIFARGEA
jgi:predicted DsbA family dithiol-disulfide isomerase